MTGILDIQPKKDKVLDFQTSIPDILTNRFRHVNRERRALKTYRPTKANTWTCKHQLRHTNKLIQKSILKCGGPGGLWDPGGCLGVWGPLGVLWGNGALWGWVMGPHNTIQMELVYYNDHRVSPLIIF
jgi:hypothetical protein